MVKNCCVSTCKTVWIPYTEISLFSFPWKYAALLKEWLKNVPTNRKITANSRICNLHFSGDCIEQKFGKRTLKKDAIPTIFVVQEESSQGSSYLSASCSTAPTTGHDNEHEKARKQPSLSHDVQIMSVGTQVSPKRLQPSAREEDLQRKIKILQAKLRRRERKLLTMSRLIRELKESGTTSDALEEALKSRFSGLNLELFRHQAKNVASQKTKIRYSDRIKEFASTLYFYSPKAYAYVREQLVALPQESTLPRWVAKFSEPNQTFANSQSVISQRNAE